MAGHATGSRTALHAQATLPPGTSVVGLGVMPGFPELFIHDSGGNDVVQLAAGQAPAAYGAPNGGGSLTNGCLLDPAFGEVASCTKRFP